MGHAKPHLHSPTENTKSGVRYSTQATVQLAGERRGHLINNDRCLSSVGLKCNPQYNMAFEDSESLPCALRPHGHNLPCPRIAQQVLNLNYG